MTKMSIISVILILSSILLPQITGEEMFCSKDRKLLLGGVFNYDRIIFGYSWKEVNSVQLWLVWRYEVKKNQLVPIEQDVAVDDIFPSIPLFRAGFGLTMKCDGADTDCKSYRQLVFIFFQTSYKVFRFANDVFFAESDKTKIPWGLKLRGEASDWFFGSHNMDNINSIMFMGGYQSQIFIVSKDVLYVSAVDIKAPTLKWTQLAESKDLTNALGGIVIGSDLYINKNEAPDSILLKYDQSGKELEKVYIKYLDLSSDSCLEILRL